MTKELIKILTIGKDQVFSSPSAYKRRLIQIDRAIKSAKITSQKFLNSVDIEEGKVGVIEDLIRNIYHNIEEHVLFTKDHPNEAYAEIVVKYAPKLYLFIIYRRWYHRSPGGLMYFRFGDILKAVVSQPTSLDIAYTEIVLRRTHKSFIKRIEKRLKGLIIKNKEHVVE